MKELFRHSRHHLDQPHDLWVSVKKAFARSEAAQVENLFLDALRRINSRP